MIDLLTEGPFGQDETPRMSTEGGLYLLRYIVRAAEQDAYTDLLDAVRTAGAWLVLHDRQQQDVERRVTAGCSQPAVERARRRRGRRPMGRVVGMVGTGRLGRAVRYGGLSGSGRRVGEQPAVPK